MTDNLIKYILLDVQQPTLDVYSRVLRIVTVEDKVDTGQLILLNSF